ALYAWYYQLQRGLGVTGMGRPIYWGFYITNFVFFIGVSHAGTLISAILRLTRAEWRRPITRAAEIITVAVIAIGASNVIIDLGREDRLLNVIFKPHLTSPLLWDVFSITTYLTGSVLYLYLPTIPDSAILRDRLPHRRWLYGPLSLGWTGTERQKKLLNRAIAIMAVIMVPIAVSVHTVVSWVFAMTIQPMWHSSIFGPYFVVGAIYSGIAAIIVAMAIIRKGCHLEAFLKPLHFDYLGRLLLVMTLLWTYFTFAEYITTYYGNSPDEIKVMMSKLTGPFAPYFWTMVICCLPIPLIILGVRRFRTITGTVSGSALTATTNESVAVSGTVSADSTSVDGTYLPSGSGSWQGRDERGRGAAGGFRAGHDGRLGPVRSARPKGPARGSAGREASAQIDVDRCTHP
ncbi:MAG: hypothetical protein B7X11_04405, partial [Acidobacteria bacterium 37-65-4]